MVRLDQDLKKHLEILGFSSTTRYRLWCHLNGLSTELSKDKEHRQSEIELYRSRLPVEDHDAGEDHDPVRAELLNRIFGGEYETGALPDVPSRVRKLYNSLEGDHGAQDAFGRLVLHTERYSKFFRPKPIIKRWGNTMENTCIAALAELSRHHADWCRPVEAWRPTHIKQRQQFSSLARHLLARYEVPLVMDSAWFQGDMRDARQQQEWFKHVGFGQNIRTAGVPMVITKRMAHLFSQENARHGTLLQALRRIQVTGLGGDSMLSHAVGTTQLGKSLENEDFWISVIYFFINNYPMLTPTYFDPIIDYIRHQKYEPERVAGPNGRIELHPPPQPSYSMKGRGADKLLRQVDEWHAQLSGTESMPLVTWEPCGISEFEFREIDAKLDRKVEWTIQELHTSAQLGVEGRIMHHCVGSYTDKCKAGRMSIWSMRVVDLEVEEPDPMHVLTIAVDPKHGTVTDYRGKYNLKPFDKKRTAGKRAVGGLYNWFLRESARVLRMWMDREGLSHSHG